MLGASGTEKVIKRRDPKQVATTTAASNWWVAGTLLIQRNKNVSNHLKISKQDKPNINIFIKTTRQQALVIGAAA